MSAFLRQAQRPAYFASVALTNSRQNTFIVSNRGGQQYQEVPNLLGRVPAQAPCFCAVKGRQVVSLSVGGFTSTG